MQLVVIGVTILAALYIGANFSGAGRFGAPGAQPAALQSPFLGLTLLWAAGVILMKAVSILVNKPNWERTLQRLRFAWFFGGLIALVVLAARGGPLRLHP